MSFLSILKNQFVEYLSHCSYKDMQLNTNLEENNYSILINIQESILDIYIN